MNFDVIRNYIEVFNMGVWGVDFLRSVVYKWIRIRLDALGIYLSMF